MNKSKRIGVLLINLGTPDAPDRNAVYRYLKEFLLDKRVIDIPYLNRQILVRGIIAPFRSGKSAKEYQKLWTEEGSPLKIYTKALEESVQQTLGDQFLVKMAMRYQNPSIESQVQLLLDAAVEKIIVFPLFPQYASATTGSIMEEVMRVISKEQTIPAITFIDQYCEDKQMIEVWARKAEAMNFSQYDYFIMSFHGLPERQIYKGDRHNVCQLGDCCHTLNRENRLCYRAQCFATARALARRLKLKDNQWKVTFQSRLGREPWLQPYTDQTALALREEGIRNVLVFCPAFVSDCLETTIEIGVELKHEFEEQENCKLDYVESLNDDPLWIDTIVGKLKQEAI